MHFLKSVTTEAFWYNSWVQPSFMVGPTEGALAQCVLEAGLGLREALECISPNSALGDFTLIASHGGSIYATKIRKCCKQFFFQKVRHYTLSNPLLALEE